MPVIYRCLTIAGSDPSGGAGIQGDLRTFAAHGQYGMAVLTALTAQNTRGVQGVFEVPPSFISLQLESIYSDIPPDVVKTGMLASASIVEAVAHFLKVHAGAPLVVDPVMVSTSGSQLLADDAVEAYKHHLIPICQLLTPNRHEASILSGVAVVDLNSARHAAEVIQQLGAKCVVVKGGDWSEDPSTVVDILFDGNVFHEFAGERCQNRNSHGTGCALSAAICCNLANGRSTVESVDAGIKYVRGGLEHAYDTGAGAGSLNHLWALEEHRFL